MFRRWSLIFLLAMPAVAHAAAVKTAGCLKALTPLVAGTIVTDASYERIACPSTLAPNALAYDTATKTVRLERGVDAGAILPRYVGYGMGLIQPGQHLQLVIRIGAVQVTRDVEALQTARSGQRLFVRDGNGTVRSVRYEATTP